MVKDLRSVYTNDSPLKKSYSEYVNNDLVLLFILAHHKIYKSRVRLLFSVTTSIITITEVALLHCNIVNDDY